MSLNTASTKLLDIGEVLSDTFSVIGRSFVVLANITVMFIAIPVVVRIAGVVLTPVSPAFAFVNLIGSLAHLAGTIFATNAILQLAMQDLHGQPVDTRTMFRIAGRKFWPAFGLVILAVLGVGLGLVLLIVPGIILALAWSAAQPALVLEDRGVFESFKRSMVLTRHKRWSIFLLYFLVLLVTVVVEMLLLALFGGLQGLLRANPTSTVISSLFSVITMPFGAVMSAALFDELRGREGYGAEAVAEVFA
jgi:hypothetical protein